MNHLIYMNAFPNYAITQSFRIKALGFLYKNKEILTDNNAP